MQIISTVMYSKVDLHQDCYIVFHHVNGSFLNEEKLSAMTEMVIRDPFKRFAHSDG